MPKYRVIAERSVTEAWTYIVTADDEEQALEMVQDCPDGECEGIQRLQDDNVYSDDTEFEILEEIFEKKPKVKKAVPDKKPKKK
jgi:hypothetical protein